MCPYRNELVSVLLTLSLSTFGTDPFVDEAGREDMAMGFPQEQLMGGSSNIKFISDSVGSMSE
jgi:hypothetical protein